MNSIFNSKKIYSGLSDPVKASYWFLLCGIIQKGLSLITTPIFTRLMSTEEYGLYNVYISWHSIWAIFITINLAAGVYLRGLVKYEDDRRSFSQSMYVLSAILATTWLVLLCIFRKPLTSFTELPLFYLVLILVDSFVCSLFQFWSAEQRVDFKYKNLVILTLLSAFVQTIVGIVAVRLSDDRVLARVLVIVCSDVFFFAWLGIIPFVNKPIHIRTAYWKYGLRFNLPLIPHYLSQVVLNQSDRIMIKRYVDPSASGLYSLAYTVASISTIVSTAIINTLTPWLYKKIRQKDFHSINTQSIIILSGVAVVNFLLILVAPEIIRILAPVEYLEAIYVIPPVTASVFFIFLYSWFSIFEFYYEKTYLMAIASLSGAVTNVFLNYVFIRKYGYIAAGYTTLFCYLLYVLGHYIFMKKICKEKLGGVQVYNITAIILVCILFVSASAAVMALYKFFFIRYAITMAILLTGFVFRKRIIEVFCRIREDKNDNN